MIDYTHDRFLILRLILLIMLIVNKTLHAFKTSKQDNVRVYSCDTSPFMQNSTSFNLFLELHYLYTGTIFLHIYLTQYLYKLLYFVYIVCVVHLPLQVISIHFISFLVDCGIDLLTRIPLSVNP